MLVENGHVNVASMRVIRVKKKIQSGNEPEYINLIEAKVVASQKAKWYLCRVAVSEDWTTLLGRPYQSCECVVRRGPTDSHQLAVFLMTLTVRTIMRRVEDKSWGVLRKHLPPYIVVMQKLPMTVHYAYGPGSQGRFKGVSTGHLKALLKLAEPPATTPEATTPEATTPATCPLVTTPVTCPLVTRTKNKKKPKSCSYRERCTAAGHPLVECTTEGCRSLCHDWCSSMFQCNAGRPKCPLHAPRITTTPCYRDNKRDKSKKLMHLPDAWANRWADMTTQPSEVVNQARMTVENIRADTEREVSYFPRHWKEQYKCDLMYERDFGLVVAKKVSRDDLWSSYLILTRKARLKRMEAARRRMRAEARQASNAGEVRPTKRGRTYLVTKVRDMLPGNYVVSGGRDLHDRLVVRTRDGVFAGYYVHQHGQVGQNPDPFTIQVGTKGACTLLADAILADNSMSQYAKMKHVWTLDRKQSTGSILVWARTHKVRHRDGAKRKVMSTREVITWRRSDDEVLFTGRSAPRTPPTAVSVTTPHRSRYQKRKRPCACGHPDCNDISSFIADKTGMDNVQANLVRTRRAGRRLMCSPTSKIRPCRRKSSEQRKDIREQLNSARTTALNRIRVENQARALRGPALDSAVFNILCHFPVRFVRGMKRKARHMMMTSEQAWGAPPHKVYKPLEGQPCVLCVPQMVCDDAEKRWLNITEAGEAEAVDSSLTSSSGPECPADLKWADDVRYVPMDGNVQPSNWSGECKYNMMNPDKYEEDPGICKRNFGYPGTFNELILRITTLWFPWVVRARSSMHDAAALTELEESLATLYFLKHASHSCDQKHLCKTWGISKYKCHTMLRVWCPRWEELAKTHCILDVRGDDDFFRFHQPAGFQERYGSCIHCELDGTTTKHDKSRRHSVKARCSYNDKCGHQAGQGLTWSTATGIVAIMCVIGTCTCMA